MESLHTSHSYPQIVLVVLSTMMDELKIGQTVTKAIYSRKKWNDTGVRLFTGQEYRFAVNPDDLWKDSFVVCNADGYRKPWLKIFERFRRVPNQNWFKLMGAIDFNEQHCFPIGTDQTMTASATGVLTCFANDLPTMYWNNSDSVHLSITRMS